MLPTRQRSVLFPSAGIIPVIRGQVGSHQNPLGSPNIVFIQKTKKLAQPSVATEQGQAGCSIRSAPIVKFPGERGAFITPRLLKLQF